MGKTRAIFLPENYIFEFQLNIFLHHN